MLTIGALVVWFLASAVRHHAVPAEAQHNYYRPQLYVPIKGLLRREIDSVQKVMNVDLRNMAEILHNYCPAASRLIEIPDYLCAHCRSVRHLMNGHHHRTYLRPVLHECFDPAIANEDCPNRFQTDPMIPNDDKIYLPYNYQLYTLHTCQYKWDTRQGPCECDCEKVEQNEQVSESPAASASVEESANLVYETSPNPDPTRECPRLFPEAQATKSECQYEIQQLITKFDSILEQTSTLARMALRDSLMEKPHVCDYCTEVPIRRQSSEEASGGVMLEDRSASVEFTGDEEDRTSTSSTSTTSTTSTTPRTSVRRHRVHVSKPTKSTTTKPKRPLRGGGFDRLMMEGAGFDKLMMEGPTANPADDEFGVDEFTPFSYDYQEE